MFERERLLDVLHTIHACSTQNLVATRYSLITTPLRTLTHFACVPYDAPLTWLTILTGLASLLYHAQLTLASLAVIYCYSLALGSIANLSQTEWRLRRPPLDQVWGIAACLGIMHVTFVYTLGILLGGGEEGAGVSYGLLLLVSLGNILGMVVLGLFVGVVGVAGWKMVCGVKARLFWPSGLGKGDRSAVGEEVGGGVGDGGDPDGGGGGGTPG